MIKGNGFFNTTAIGDFHPTLSGDCRPTLTMLLETRFIETQKYVELTPDNFNTYSDEYASLLISIGAEIDVLFKLNCGIHLSERTRIDDYVSLLPEVKTKEIEIINREMETIEPFICWDKEKPAQSLEWWQAYNYIKHARGDNREKASQKNVLNSLAALCLLENLMLKKIAGEYGCMDVPSEYSKFFYLVDWKYNSPTYNKSEKDLYMQFDINDEKDRELIELFESLGWENSLIDYPEE